MQSKNSETRDAMFTRGLAAFAAQAFSQFIGAELAAYSSDGVEIRLRVRPELRQQYGFVHGGVLSYLADNALAFAGGAALDGLAVTSELKLNYIRPATGEVLIARARAISAGRTQSVARCDIFSVEDGTERLCAAAQGTIAVTGKPSASP
ncbi:PaaI family thioesterase [Bosea vestrisii]|uniref:Medium/long-chain acyl-CoA thioesterase YigI n=1 Tax=Bosea vestrisii TaxID=151416 RepID=A0ABW0HJK5_9HYPH